MSLHLASKIVQLVSTFPEEFHQRIVDFCKQELRVADDFFLSSAAGSFTVVLSNFSKSDTERLFVFVEELQQEFLESPLYSIKSSVRAFYKDRVASRNLSTSL